MAEAAMEWDDVWAYLRTSSEDDWKYFFKHLNIIQAVEGIAPKYQIEILVNAPRWVQKYCSSVLHNVTKEALCMVVQPIEDKRPHLTGRFRVMIS